MTAGGVITRAFGDAEHPFLLKVEQWREVEKACDAGLGIIAARISPLVQLIEFPGGPEKYPGGLMGAIAAGLLGSFRVDDIREPLKHGLIGGGMTSTEAGALVRAVFDEEAARGRGPALRWARLAFDILMGALIGLEDEPLPAGEPEAAKRKPSRRSPTAKPASRKSTAPAR